MSADHTQLLRAQREAVDEAERIAALERAVVDASLSWFGTRSIEGSAYTRERAMLEANETLHAQVAALTGALTGTVK